MVWGGTRYIYLKNAQGDITGIRSETDGSVFYYLYDAWGHLEGIRYNDNSDASGLLAAKFNPLRYRGYVYDPETGFYYLNSRFYFAYMARFLNADRFLSGVGSLKEFNLFSYSFNSPISFTDSSGTFPISVNDDMSTMYRDYSGIVTARKALEALQAKKESHDENRRPNTGEPGSTWKAPNGDWRQYGPDGKQKLDYDHDDHTHPELHPHDENGGHYHDWDWSKVPPRQPPRLFSWEPLLGVGLIVACGVGILVIAADDFTGIGIADDFLFGPLGSGIGYGIGLLLG